eukprot:TRINITY_DN2274_c0_g2_i1.p3 TRINITY_DN2274_c0_g2~~TRINITY_DN2274_c0_g2_i1.p3  ORF type:complete len:272 (-),score=28.78 TRINITY_DN2274_c0_g2_i1:2063-2878(-)
MFRFHILFGILLALARLICGQDQVVGLVEQQYQSQDTCQLGDDEYQYGTISVVGFGTVSIPSDMATISLSIEGQAQTVNEARNLVAESSAKVSQALQELLPAENVHPISVTIAPEQREVRTDDGQIMNIIEQYTYSNSIDIEIFNVTSINIAQVLDRAVLAGQEVVNIQRIAFSLSSNVSIEASKLAREIAFKDALAKASEYAQEINSTLGPIQSISEYPPHGSSPASITSLPGSHTKFEQKDLGMDTISRNELTATVYVDYATCLVQLKR